MFHKASDGLNLMITNKIESLDSIEYLIYLKTKVETIEKINKNERLEVKKIEYIVREILDEFKTEKTEKWKWKLRFLILTNRCFKKLSDHEEEKEARKVTRKCMEELYRFKIKKKGIKKLIKETTEYDSSKRINDLSFEKWLTTEEIKDIDTIKRSPFTNVTCEYYSLYPLYLEWKIQTLFFD